MDYKFRNKNGITLIALVVTIIILLILVGIVLATLTGENRIINRVGEASKKTKKETAREQIQLEVMEVLITKGDIDVTQLKTNLQTNMGADVSKINDILIDEALTGKITIDGNEFYVDKNGKVLDYDGPNRTDTPKVSETTKEFSRANGTTDIVFLENTGYKISETPNAPALDNTMVPVKYDEETTNWIVCSTIDPKWYHYEKQEGTAEGKSSEWANVMLTDDIVVKNANPSWYTGGSDIVGAYKTNKEQSTTGNVHGIYDTVGGNVEYVASYIANSQNSYGYQFAANDGQATSKNDNDVSTKYATVYKYNTASDTDVNNYNLSLNKIFGDGTTETSITGTGANSWYSGYSFFGSLTDPFFARGGAHDFMNSGSFYFSRDSGRYSYYNGSRVVCIVN